VAVARRQPSLAHQPAPDNTEGSAIDHNSLCDFAYGVGRLSDPTSGFSKKMPTERLEVDVDGSLVPNDWSLVVKTGRGSPE